MLPTLSSRLRWHSYLSDQKVVILWSGVMSWVIWINSWDFFLFLLNVIFHKNTLMNLNLKPYMGSMNSAFTRKVPNPGQFVHDLECGKNICARKITYISIMTRNVIYGRICLDLYFYTNIYIQSFQNEQSNNGCKST